MSGHSKWSTIKRKKGKTDAARGKIFTKLIKEITIASRDGGGDEGSNPRLRTAIITAKSANMPADNIKRAILKGTGELPGAVYEELTYEGYGPGGVAILVECVTDNKQRTVADVRHIFGKHGGNLGENGCVAFIFERQGQIEIPAENVVEDDLMEASLDAGAENFEPAGDAYIITTPNADLHTVSDALAAKGYKIESAEIVRNPNTTVELDEDSAVKFMKFY
ncbi:YebC/PmpR family DNA-binding transcriptional regulator, partial [Gemmatimonas aurantiaca]|nr:YebC/PmpR family DNA-binding transcriptional regulator [Gemmatimonas aurantiaca]